LEFTTERRQTGLSSVDVRQRTVTKTGSSTGNLVLLSGQNGSRGSTGASGVTVVVDGVIVGSRANVLFELVFGGHYDIFFYVFFRGDMENLTRRVRTRTS